MAKKRSKDSGKDKRQRATTKGVAAPGASGGTAAAIDPAASKEALKVSAGVRKQIRRLERQLADAARQERKRLRKLERARHRRQVAEAALADVLAETPAPPVPAAKPAPAAKSTPAAKVAPAAAKAAASTPARPRAARAAPSTRRAAPKPTPAKPVSKPATPPEPDKP